MNIKHYSHCFHSKSPLHCNDAEAPSHSLIVTSIALFVHLLLLALKVMTASLPLCVTVCVCVVLDPQLKGKIQIQKMIFCEMILNELISVNSKKNRKRLPLQQSIEESINHRQVQFSKPKQWEMMLQVIINEFW